MTRVPAPSLAMRAPDELVGIFRRQEIVYRTGQVGITPNLDMADWCRQMADAFESQGNPPLWCSVPSRGFPPSTQKERQ